MYLFMYHVYVYAKFLVQLQTYCDDSGSWSEPAGDWQITQWLMEWDFFSQLIVLQCTKTFIRIHDFVK